MTAGVVISLVLAVIVLARVLLALVQPDNPIDRWMDRHR